MAQIAQVVKPMRHNRYSVLALAQKQNILITNTYIPEVKPLFLWHKMPLLVKIWV